MRKFNLKMTKVFVTTVTGLIIIGMIGSILTLKSSYYWRSQFFAMQLNYAKTKIAFIVFNYGSIIDWIFADKNVTAEASSSAQVATSVPILLYHGVIDNPLWIPDDVNIRTSDFQKQIFTLKKAGYQTITVEDYLAFIRGQKQLPAKSFLLTFDDGRKDSYYPVDPILRTVGYSAVMHVITGRSLGPDNDLGTFHLSELELRKMIESGRWEMESHGRNDHDYVVIDASGKDDGHFLSDKIWLSSSNRIETDEEFQKRISTDLFESKYDLEKQLGINVTAFAYPFGDYGQESLNYPENKPVILAAAKLVYPLSFTQAGNSDYPTNFAENDFLAKRINVNSNISANDLLKILQDSEAKSLPYNDDLSKNNGWIRGWGTMEMKNGEILLSDSENEDSGVTFLNGSYLWKDYDFRASVVLKKSNTFALTGRYADANNYMACDFSNGQVSFTQRVNGMDLPDISTLQPTGFVEGNTVNVGLSVQENIGSCYVNGKQFVSGTIEKSLNNGGIGFKIWDLNPGQKGNTIIIQQLNVTGTTVNNNTPPVKTTPVINTNAAPVDTVPSAPARKQRLP